MYFCKHCGERFFSEEVNFCARCGTQRGQGKTFCANCGNVIREKEETCSYCGQPLTNNDEKSMDIGLAIASLILGIISLYLSFIQPIVGLIPSIITIILGKKAQRGLQSQKTIAIAGVVCGIFATIFAIIPVLFGGGSISEILFNILLR